MTLSVRASRQAKRREIKSLNSVLCLTVFLAVASIIMFTNVHFCDAKCKGTYKNDQVLFKVILFNLF